jgi:hypothetical protein
MALSGMRGLFSMQVAGGRRAGPCIVQQHTLGPLHLVAISCLLMFILARTLLTVSTVLQPCLLLQTASQNVSGEANKASRSGKATATSGGCAWVGLARDGVCQLCSGLSAAHCLLTE